MQQGGSPLKDRMLPFTCVHIIIPCRHASALQKNPTPPGLCRPGLHSWWCLASGDWSTCTLPHLRLTTRPLFSFISCFQSVLLVLPSAPSLINPPDCVSLPRFTALVAFPFVTCLTLEQPATWTSLYTIDPVSPSTCPTHSDHRPFHTSNRWLRPHIIPARVNPQREPLLRPPLVIVASTWRAKTCLFPQNHHCRCPLPLPLLRIYPAVQLSPRIAPIRHLSAGRKGTAVSSQLPLLPSTRHFLASPSLEFDHVSP